MKKGIDIVEIKKMSIEELETWITIFKKILKKRKKIVKEVDMDKKKYKLWNDLTVEEKIQIKRTPAFGSTSEKELEEMKYRFDTNRNLCSTIAPNLLKKYLKNWKERKKNVQYVNSNADQSV